MPRVLWRGRTQKWEQGDSPFTFSITSGHTDEPERGGNHSSLTGAARRDRVPAWPLWLGTGAYLGSQRAGFGLGPE